MEEPIIAPIIIKSFLIGFLQFIRMFWWFFLLIVFFKGLNIIFNKKNYNWKRKRKR
jgi:type II secretory pathway component PulF